MVLVYRGRLHHFKIGSFFERMALYILKKIIADKSQRKIIYILMTRKIIYYIGSLSTIRPLDFPPAIYNFSD